MQTLTESPCIKEEPKVNKIVGGQTYEYPFKFSQCYLFANKKRFKYLMLGLTVPASKTHDIIKSTRHRPVYLTIVRKH